MKWALLAVALSQTGCYYLAQAGGQLDILWHREAIGEVLKREGLSERDRAKLGLVREARSSARP